jgi:hypothetical protein
MCALAFLIPRAEHWHLEPMDYAGQAFLTYRAEPFVRYDEAS